MSDDFDAILDRCLADISAGRETVDSCRRRYPVYAGQLPGLLAAAEWARAAPPPAPLPTDKRRALESRLVRRAGQLRSQPAPQPAPQPVPRPTRLRLPLWRRGFTLAVASFVVVLLLFSSAVSASAASVPGDFLYPVKRAAEQVRLTLAAEQQQVDLHLEFARQRLQELQVLTDRGEVPEDLLGEISSETTLVLDRAEALPQDRQRAVLASLTDFQAQDLQVLEKIASSAQGNARAKVLAALADAAARRQQAMKLLAGAASQGNPADDSAREPRPTILTEETRPPQGNSTAKPDSTDKPKPQTAPKATKVPAVKPNAPTPKAEHTPPGQARQSAPQAPPGQADQPAPQSPPGKPTKDPTK